MPRFRVKTGSTLAQGGAVLEAGAVVELPRHIAADSAVSHAIEEIDDKGNAIASPAPDDLERFRTHERVGMLRDRLDQARRVATDLEGQLEREEQRLADEVQAAASRRTKPATPAATGTAKE